MTKTTSHNGDVYNKPVSRLYFDNHRRKILMAQGTLYI
ncbi:guanylate kinase, partial [Escherichia coli]